MDGQDKGQVGGGLVVEAQNELPIAVIANLSCVPNVLADPGTHKKMLEKTLCNALHEKEGGCMDEEWRQHPKSSQRGPENVVVHQEEERKQVCQYICQAQEYVENGEFEYSQYPGKR